MRFPTTDARPRHPEKVARPDQPSPRKPPWIRVKAPGSPEYHTTRRLMRDLQLNTVCEEAACPNIGECWKEKHATMMILGAVCTRACTFCNVATGRPDQLDPHEPARRQHVVQPRKGAEDFCREMFRRMHLIEPRHPAHERVGAPQRLNGREGSLIRRAQHDELAHPALGQHGERHARDQSSHAMGDQDHRLPIRDDARRKLRAELIETETPVIGVEQRPAALDLELQLELRVGEEQNAGRPQRSARRQSQRGQSPRRDIERIDPQHPRGGAAAHGAGSRAPGCAARRSADFRSHDSGQYQHRRTVRLFRPCRGRGEHGQLRISRRAEVFAQTLRVPAVDQSTEHLIVAGMKCPIGAPGGTRRGRSADCWPALRHPKSPSPKSCPP